MNEHKLADRLMKKIESKKPPKWKRGGKFGAIEFGKLYELSSMSKSSIRVLFFLMDLAEMKNEIPYNQSEIASMMNIRPQVLSRWLGEIKKRGLVYKYRHRLYLSPYFCWRGSEPQRQEQIKLHMDFMNAA